MRFIRKGELAKKILITDGLPGCGKTMLSPILSSLDKVEMFYFAFEVEFVSRLFHFGEIKKKSAISLIRMLTDYKLYNSMMGREINLRHLDLSSVTRHHNHKEYLKRLKSTGNHSVPKIINKKKPILHLTTHDLLNYSRIVLEALAPRLTYVELIRHPMDMVNQQIYIMKDHFKNPRSIQIEFEYKNQPLPYWSNSWKNKFLRLNNVDRAIYNIFKMYKDNIKNRNKIKKLLKNNYICVPFEKFTINPTPILKKVSKSLKNKITKATLKEMKIQKIPRKNFFNTPQTTIYKKVGGSLADIENREKDIERKIKIFKKKGATKKYLNLLEKISKDYEKKYV